MQKQLETKSHALVVDLDGTLIKTDMLFETLILFMKKKPWALLMIPIWLFGGMEKLKERLAQEVIPDPTLIPYHEEVVNWCRAQAAAGVPVYLATGTNIRVAESMAQHLGFFCGVIASDGFVNRVGAAKLSSIEETLKNAPFTYAGDCSTDLPIWASAAGAVTVGVSASLRNKVAQHTKLEQVFEVPSTGIKTLTKAIRVHQWVKNLLVFVPLFTAHKFSLPIFATACIAFAAFCLISSSVYVLNDLLDLEADRAHPRKSQRPFASGRLSIFSGLVLLPLLVLGALALSLLLPTAFRMILLTYLAVTLAYSFYLKPRVLIDVLTLASLFTLRIFAGAFALNVVLSEWLLAFSVFIFLSLAFVKRYAELDNLKRRGLQMPPGRAYRVEDADQLATFGVTSGYMAVLVLALYMNSPKVAALYNNSELLWLMCPTMIYWTSRIWLAARRGEMNEDPIIFAFKDKASYAVGFIMLAVVLAAI